MRADYKTHFVHCIIEGVTSYHKTTSLIACIMRNFVQTEFKIGLESNTYKTIVYEY